MADSKISALTSYSTPLDADVLPVVDTANTTTKKLTWANLKATLKTYLDTLYQATLVSGTNIKTINSSSILGSGNLSISATVADGDKGDIVVSSSGAVWDIDAATVGLTELSATGTPSSSTFLRGDNTWAVPAGSGDVSKVGTPVDNQVGVWTGNGTIEGDADLTFDTTSNTLGLAAVAGTSIYAQGGANILVDSPRGTMTLSNIDAIDATTESTIEAAIDTLANLTSIQGQTVTLSGSLTVGAAASVNQNVTTTGNPQFSTIELGAATDTTISRVSAGVIAVEGNNVVTNTSSPTLATITTTGNIELGNASDTTLSRAGAGDLAVEGVSVLTTSNTKTVTNKRNQPRVVSAASYTTDTGTSLDVSTCDTFIVTAQAGALKLNNPSGTPVQGEKLVVRIKDNGTARALTYDTQFRASSDLALPTTTVISKTLYMGFMYNSTDTKWDLIAVLNNF